MKVTKESLENFKRVPVGSTLLGIRDMNTSEVHLALQSARPAATWPQDQLSRIQGVTIDPLPRGGGHSRLAALAGVTGAQQVGQGVALGAAIGFTLEKTGGMTFEIATWLSGLNSQGAYQDTRPAGAGVRELGTVYRQPVVNDLEYALTPLLMRPFTKARQLLSPTKRDLGV